MVVFLSFTIAAKRCFQIPQSAIPDFAIINALTVARLLYPPFMLAVLAPRHDHGIHGGASVNYSAYFIQRAKYSKLIVI
jgi:hypothetical protein